MNKGDKDNNKLISIITIVRNGVEHIEQTIQSVISQKKVGIEYIIVDGNSTDGTLEIIEKYRSEIDIIISETDNGIYDAINKGIRHATGCLIGIIHCGDFYAPDSLLKVYNKYKEAEGDVFYGDIEIMEEYKTDYILNYGKANHKLLIKRMSIFHPSSFIKHSIYKSFGSYNQNYKSASDYDFFLRLFLQDYKFVYIPYRLAFFRSGGMSSNNFKLSLRENYQIRKKHLNAKKALSYVLLMLFNHSIFTLRKVLIVLIISEDKYYKLKQNKSKLNNAKHTHT